MPEAPVWDERYPDKARLRLEVEALQEAVLEALLELTPAANVVGVYTKGSTVKAWDSPLDYVPELSDVDIQLLLHDERRLRTLEGALEFQAGYEARFRARVPEPLHLPRPQIILLREMLSSFAPAPARAVKTLYGRPYPEVHPLTDTTGMRKFDQEKLLQYASPEILAGFPLSWIDKPGKYLFLALRDLSWRVGPAGSRVLSLLGVEFDRAWGSNRTEIYAQLQELGQAEFAQRYAGFYLEGWRFFLSGYQDSEAGRRALLAGARVIELGLDLAAR